MTARILLTETQIGELIKEYPRLPADYINYLSATGWGEAPSGMMIYQGPTTPTSIYGGGYEGPEDVVVLGDDYQGYCLGYDLTHERYGEISDFGKWEPWAEGERLEDYVTPDDKD